MADSEPNNSTESNDLFVDPNTDDLDAFNRLLVGKAKEAPDKPAEGGKPIEEKKEPVEPEPKVDTSEPENNDEPETKEDKPDGEEPPKPEKKVSRYQERINELTAKAREAERREAEAQRKLDELDRRTKNPTEASTPAASVAKDDSPTPDDRNEDGSDKYPLGEFDPSYIRDLTRHTIQKEQAAATERFEQERVKREEAQAREQLQTRWAEKLTSVTETHEDFLEKTMELEDTFEGLDPNYSDYLVQTIKSLDHGPEVLYHFANNLAEAQKFVKLGPLAATLALGEINARFNKSETAEPKPTPKVTKAPVPPQVNKGSATRTNVAGDTDDLDAFSRAFFKRGG